MRAPGVPRSPSPKLLLLLHQLKPASLYALLSPTVPNGAYVVDCEPTDTSPASKAPRARAELWEWSAAWLRARGIDATL